MKTLILYASKHGATREIAGRIAQQMDDAALIDLGSGNVPPLNDYDCVLVGSPVYAGTLREEAKAFVAQHADALKTKRLGLFLSGMAPEGAEGYLESNYPKDVVAHAKGKVLLGGVFDPAKGNFFEKLVMRLIAKKSTYENTISDEKIKQFVEVVTA